MASKNFGSVLFEMRKIRQIYKEKLANTNIFISFGEPI